MAHSGSFAHGANNRFLSGKKKSDDHKSDGAKNGNAEEQRTYASEEAGVIGRQMTYKEIEDDQGGPPTIVSR